MRKIAFTLCSNNYLAQAKVLCDTLLEFNPDFEFYVGLVDKYSDAIDYKNYINCPVLEIDTLFEDKAMFADMVERYNITELNTSVKPFVFKYFFNSSDPETQVYYFDPDIEIFDSLNELVDILKENNGVLTPHLMSPIFDDKEEAPSESYVINAGLYNLGFLGLKKSQVALSLLDWWGDKCQKNCYSWTHRGIFVDQSWMSHAPLFFENMFILKKPNYNYAYWNFHERSLASNGKSYLVNGEHDLVFFHYSGFNPLKPNVIAKYQEKYHFENCPDYKDIYKQYAQKLHNANFEEISKLPCVYIVDRPQEIRTVEAVVIQKTFRDYAPKNPIKRVVYYLQSYLG